MVNIAHLYLTIITKNSKQYLIIYDSSSDVGGRLSRSLQGNIH